MMGRGEKKTIGKDGRPTKINSHRFVFSFLHGTQPKSSTSRTQAWQMQATLVGGHGSWECPLSFDATCKSICTTVNLLTPTVADFVSVNCGSRARLNLFACTQPLLRLCLGFGGMVLVLSPPVRGWQWWVVGCCLLQRGGSTWSLCTQDSTQLAFWPDLWRSNCKTHWSIEDVIQASHAVLETDTLAEHVQGKIHRACT